MKKCFPSKMRVKGNEAREDCLSRQLTLCMMPISTDSQTHCQKDPVEEKNHPSVFQGFCRGVRVIIKNLSGVTSRLNDERMDAVACLPSCSRNITSLLPR